MSIGPSIIFDKSALQGLSVDESMWLESFYITNITPLFFVETLADLEKEMRNGRIPEDIVGSIARKTPDMGCMNVHHRNLIGGELLGHGKVGMSGRPIIPRGQTVELEGKTGIMHLESPEMEASHRWQKKQFLEIERSIAKEWRQELALMGDEDYSHFEYYFNTAEKPKTFEELKKQVDDIIDGMDNKEFLDYGMALMEILPAGREMAIKRWQESGSKPIKEFAPYFAYVLSIDLFFVLGKAAKLFGVFPHPQTHKVDVAYLYYLPFCNIFTSSDKIHIALTQIFMRSDQTFVSGSDLKNDFANLDAYYDKLPEEVKEKGTMVFAPCPPDDDSFLTTQLWNKYMSKEWRNIKDNARKFDGTDKVDPEMEKEMLEHIRKFAKEAKPIDTAKVPNSDEADNMIIRHMVSAQKGKWKKFPPEVLKSKPIIHE
jgi:hypothetical protein